MADLNSAHPPDPRSSAFSLFPEARGEVAAKQWWPDFQPLRANRDLVLSALAWAARRSAVSPHWAGRVAGRNIGRDKWAWPGRPRKEMPRFRATAFAGRTRGLIRQVALELLAKS